MSLYLPQCTKRQSRRRPAYSRVDTYDWLTFLPMSEGGGAYSRYFGRLNTGKIKIRGGNGPERGDTPEYVSKMQQEVSRSWPRPGA